jgi:hypothetical protein
VAIERIRIFKEEPLTIRLLRPIPGPTPVQRIGAEVDPQVTLPTLDSPRCAKEPLNKGQF